MTHLAWGLRQGFRDYLFSLEDMRTDLIDVVWDSRAEHWLFPLDRTGALLRIRAHDGALDIEIADPRVVAVDGGLALVLAGGDQVATILDTGASIDDTLFKDVALTASGSALFGGIYRPWARMDPVLIVR